MVIKWPLKPLLDLVSYKKTFQIFTEVFFYVKIAVGLKMRVSGSQNFKIKKHRLAVSSQEKLKTLFLKLLSSKL